MELKLQCWIHKGIHISKKSLKICGTMGKKEKGWKEWNEHVTRMTILAKMMRDGILQENGGSQGHRPRNSSKADDKNRK